MRTVALPVAFCLSLLASPAVAQSPFPGGVNVNGGWVPCNHPIAINAGLGCTSSPTPPAAPTPSRDDCETIDPYAAPVLRWACEIERSFRRFDAPSNFFKHGEGPLVKVQPTVGRRYQNVAYLSLGDVLVRGTSLNPQGRLVVTYEYLTGEQTGQTETIVNGAGHRSFQEVIP
jgi:hypothetical protein